MGTHPFTRRGRGSLHRICCQNDRECYGLSVGSTLRSLLRRWSVQEDSVERKATRASPRLQIHVDGGRPKADSRVVRCQLRLGTEVKAWPTAQPSSFGTNAIAVASGRC